MNFYNIIDGNIMAALTLGIVLWLGYSNLNRKDKTNEIYLHLITIILIIVMLEIASLYLVYKGALLSPVLGRIVNSLGFIFTPIAAAIWLMYIESRLKQKVVHSAFLYTPIIINSCICILNLKYNLIFAIDKQNIYTREFLFMLPVGISFAFIIRGFFCIVKYRKEIDKKQANELFLFFLAPFVGMIIQLNYSYILTIWTYAGIGLSLHYIYDREKVFRYDPLTGAWSRLAFEAYLNNNLNTSMGLIYIDIDDFKCINDTYGHEEGDKVLKQTVALLTKCFYDSGIVARVGGDEFVISIRKEYVHDLENLVNAMYIELEVHNEKNQLPYCIALSSGYDIFNDSFVDLKEFLNHVDSLMYSSKKSKKCCIREEK